MNVKAVIWLVLAAGLILTPLVFAFIAVFPYLISAINFATFLLFFVFAGGMLALYAMFNKIKKNPVFVVAVLGCILAPVVFSVTQAFPFLPNLYGWVLLLMHVVLSGGFLVLYTQWSKIKKLF